MRSATQDRHWPDRLGSRSGGSGAPQLNSLEKLLFAPSIWPIPNFWSVRSGQYPCFGLYDLTNTDIGAFSLANTNLAVCSLLPTFIPTDHTHIPVCSFWRILKIVGVWPGQYLYSTPRGPALKSSRLFAKCVNVYVLL